MHEQSPTSIVPQALLNKVTTPERHLAGFGVKKINKTGSSLHLLESEEKKGIVRNAEMPISAMVTWEFLERYAQRIIPGSEVKKLFGEWGKPQVAPILDKGDEARVYYSEHKAAAYSELAGLDTMRLAELWHLQDELIEYSVQDWFPRESRWMDCTSYHLATDVIKEVPSFDPEHQLSKSLEDFWDEFGRLNGGNIGRRELLQHKELRRQDMDHDQSYRASLKLIETGHEIVGWLRAKYSEVVSLGSQETWKDKPVKDVLLLLIHLYQTSVQQMILWWFGVSHGHLHMYNSVSKLSEPGSPEAEISPLITSIIDFDAAQVSPSKLSENDELYTLVDVPALKAQFKKEKLNPALKLQLLFYLPLPDWDEEMMRFVRESDSSLLGKLVQLISDRARKDLNSPAEYTRFTEFVYQLEQKNSDKQFPIYGLTLEMLKDGVDLLHTTNPDLAVVANYLKNGDAFFREGSPRTDSQNALLLCALYFKGAYGIGVTLTTAEYQFAISFLDQKSQLGKNAVVLIDMATKDMYEEEPKEILQAVRKGEQAETQIMKKILQFVFSKQESAERFGYMQRDLFSQFFEIGKAELLLQLVGLEALPREQAVIAYQNLRTAVNENWKLDDFPDQKSELSKKLNELGKKSLGKAYILRQNIQEKVKSIQERLNKKHRFGY